MTATLQLRSKISTRALCAQPGLAASTLRRWRRRAAQGVPLLQRPGPKKPGPLPMDEVHREIEALLHAPRRSRGTGALYRRFGGALSRRDLGRWVQQQRQWSHRAQRHRYQSIRWNKPNVAWAIDATEYGKDHQGRPLFLVVTTDLATRYTFDPLVTLAPAGEAIAAHLRALFGRHGQPLLLKRDNGSIFKNQAVDRLLAAEAVIPLDSPPYYPRYNGGIEKAIRELKVSLHRCLPQTPPSRQPPALTPFVHAAAHLRNGARRRSLGGATAAQTYQGLPPARFTVQERHATFLWIKRRSAAILADVHLPNRHDAATAWRTAVRHWLQSQRLITIHPKQPTQINQPMLPHFHLSLCS
jgi:Integrase core domain